MLSGPTAASAELVDTLNASKISGYAAGRPVLKRNGGKTRHPRCRHDLERATSFLSLAGAIYEHD